MAGHRRGRGPGGATPPRRRDQRAADYLARLEAATTVEAQLAIAFDWYRSAAFRHPARQHHVHQMATELANRARTLEAAA
jgi:hypothetical protein